ncbi:aspartate--tRNA ligase [Halothermothrix orenii]|uniref:Aspartate--tRNA(Asp/Asn) ligase n=1 Tax=Halothermothrix orenii (strain H 168 / OCM 544 / DSM 9562) TaxID=373903 RepID=SYDND_HALOH|nr:aspartate--tRNA ligase [Halothermothrix orenii]B8CXE5.1 RecName: Full=Aspartate--tRNA(Asp/Asn) ligase; AltName: Full=Aspartyl-tRNA synthetase; Short=AspRS; AltName: Full=Non-discriminating aspartyl-tRNA synthetase; Short=ND-AspRS [Halothermothrix orenii H 168]ACL69964.1 Aspartyl-tRNA synthetase [Halothermothrix orenii H 168]
MAESINGLKRTHYAGKISTQQIGKKVTVMGWVQKRRDHGGVIFIDLRDRSGIVQVVFNPDNNERAFKKATELRSEYVIAVEGEVEKRPEGNINPDIPTGEIEIRGNRLRILDESETPPFEIDDDINVGEDLRLKYRYLDLRRPRMKKNLELRHRVMKTTRDYLDDNGFWEVETPILTRSTPEGARDYLVPSRIHPGHFYALPQSPQLFKQLLMVGGVERYFQIARCFRDEDLRANRQPEFTQIDIEMSFIDKEDVFSLVNGLMKRLFALVDIEIPEKIPVMPYQEAIDRFGSDKPDLRFGMELKDVSDVVKDSEFRVFSGVVKDGGQVKGINFKGGAISPRSKIDGYTDYVKIFGAKGLAWIALKENGLKSPIAKFLSEKELEGIKEKMGAQTGDLLLFVADKPSIVADALGNLRLKIAREEGLIPDGVYKFVWVVDFPLMEYDEDEGRYVAKHHPFTAPLDEDIPLLDSNPEKIRSKAYDFVLNGEELGGGSIRINNKDLQMKVFNALNISEEKASDKFGFLLEAFNYGAPPHGGIAFGLDRLLMVLSGSESMRDVIAFPKTQKASSPLTEAPSTVAEKQLRELHIKID